jgi:hypothetical protein
MERQRLGRTATCGAIPPSASPLGGAARCMRTGDARSSPQPQRLILGGPPQWGRGGPRASAVVSGGLIDRRREWCMGRIRFSHGLLPHERLVALGLNSSLVIVWSAPLHYRAGRSAEKLRNGDVVGAHNRLARHADELSGQRKFKAGHHRRPFSCGRVSRSYG